MAGDLSHYIGIDPGKAGGIAVVDHLGIVALTSKMPATVGDLLELLGRLGGLSRPRAVLERVNAGVFGQGKAGRMGVTSAFTFGRGVGRLETALAASQIPYDSVSPLTWQKALGCQSGGDKNVTKARAQALFPGVTVTHAIADALLLAEFCRRYWRQMSDPRGGQHGEESSQDAGGRKEVAGEGWQGAEAGRVVEAIESSIEFAVEVARAAGAGAPGARASTKRRTR